MNGNRSTSIIASIFTLVFVFGTAVDFGAEVSNPVISSLIPVNVPLGDSSHNYPQMATQLDLASLGFVEKEFYLEGSAIYYDVPRFSPAEIPSTETAEVISTGRRYKTRMVVRGPLSEKDFNGTVVIMEWLNVTSQYNLDAMWLTSYAHILREGYAYVGVSVQRVGIHAPGSGLHQWCPLRDGDLDVTDDGKILNDGLAFDIWSQAAKAIWSPQSVDHFGGLRPLFMIATGASQSQQFLVWYHNSIQPMHNMFDGFLLYIGTGSLLRTDLDTRVIKLNTENDVIFLGEYFARQPDTQNLRTYEVAGNSHVGFSEPNLRAELLVRDSLPIADTAVCDRPALSRIPTYHVANAAFEHLRVWITYAIEPPKAPLLEMVSAPPVVLRRDAYGNALGGIQLSQHAVATATNTGINSGPGFCFLFGSHEPFDENTLLSLYRNHGQYVFSKVVQTFCKPLSTASLCRQMPLPLVKKQRSRTSAKESLIHSRGHFGNKTVHCLYGMAQYMTIYRLAKTGCTTLY